jgi:hypothetical protein
MAREKRKNANSTNMYVRCARYNGVGMGGREGLRDCPNEREGDSRQARQPALDLNHRLYV